MLDEHVQVDKTVVSILDMNLFILYLCFSPLWMEAFQKNSDVGSMLVDSSDSHRLLLLFWWLNDEVCHQVVCFEDVRVLRSSPCSFIWTLDLFNLYKISVYTLLWFWLWRFGDCNTIFKRSFVDLEFLIKELFKLDCVFQWLMIYYSDWQGCV